MYAQTYKQQHIWHPHLLCTANIHPHRNTDIRVRIWQRFELYEENGDDTETKQRWMENAGSRNEATRDQQHVAASRVCLCGGKRKRDVNKERRKQREAEK